MDKYDLNSISSAEVILLSKKNPLEGIPLQVNYYMTQKLFESILNFLGYTNKKYPKYKDPFYEVREMIRMCKFEHGPVFYHGCMTCIIEFMSFWSNNYTCP